MREVQIADPEIWNIESLQQHAVGVCLQNGRHFLVMRDTLAQYIQPPPMKAFRMLMVQLFFLLKEVSAYPCL